MTRHDRLTQILELASTRGEVSVHELVEELGASPATVRRDLDELASQQLITRTRGGARASAIAYDLPLKYKTARQADEKQRIAAHAVSLIGPGQVVGLNGGTTTTLVAERIATDPRLQDLRDGERLTVVTNALNIANDLTVRQHVRIILTGGTARTRSYELVGPLAVHTLTQVTVDVAFLGVNAVDVEHGAMGHHEGEAAISRLMAQAARRVVVVADSSKLGRTALAPFVEPGRIDLLITTTEADQDLVEAFRDSGLEVAVV